MRQILGLVLLSVTLSGCGFFKKSLGVKDDSGAYREPSTTSIFGNWVLREPDSTAFAGARLVELELNQSNFTIRADYLNRPQVVVRGRAGVDETGLLTLIPEAGTDPSFSQWRGIQLQAGQPLSLIASASGSTLVFARPIGANESFAVEPTSVWHKKTTAEAAGIVERDSTQRRP